MAMSAAEAVAGAVRPRPETRAVKPGAVRAGPVIGIARPIGIIRIGIAVAGCEAFEDTMQDPAFLSEMKTRKLDVVPVSWPVMVDLLKDSYSTPRDIVDEAKAIIAGE